MKLSSISLVATAIAAIAGSGIAAPGPLHARALDVTNSFDDRDVEVNSRESGLALLEREIDNEVVDGLFTRGRTPLYVKSANAAEEHKKAAKAWQKAGDAAAHFYVKSKGHGHFKQEEDHCLKEETKHLEEESKHKSNAKTFLHRQYADDEERKQARAAHTSIEEARSSGIEANKKYDAILDAAREKGLHH